jgi:copper chaperone CopZ
MLLNDSISEIDGVEKVSSDFKNGIIVVNCKTDETLLKVKKIIEKEGYKVIG